jgi:hypothetical protein
MQVSITVQQDITIDSVTVVWHGNGGQEISSGTLGICELITAGQTLSFAYDESMGSDPTPRQAPARARRPNTPTDEELIGHQPATATRSRP